MYRVLNMNRLHLTLVGMAVTLLVGCAQKQEESLKVKVTVTNTGSVEGDEVVQLYAHDELASVARPMKQLVAFKRITLAPGESCEVELEVPYRQFGLWDREMHFGVEEGWFELWLGRNANERITGGRTYVAARGDK